MLVPADATSTLLNIMRSGNTLHSLPSLVAACGGTVPA